MQCAANHASQIVVTSTWMSAIMITHGASYWDINGCDVSASGLNGSAIGIGGQFSAPYGALTHIIIENNVVHDSSCGGIAAAGNTNGGLPLDYLIIRGNVAYGNAKTASYDCSGISIYEPKAYDQAPGYHLLVQQNVSFNNFDCDTCHTVTTDGNGIIMDDFASSQQSSGTPYQPATLVENNLAFNNGGMGIHSFFSENITFRNNTAWGDLQDPQHCSGGYEIGAEFSSNIQFYNNLAEATRATLCNSPVYAMEVYGGGISTGISIDWILAYGVGGHDIAIEDAPAVSLGHGNWQGTNPKLIGPFRPTTLPQVSQIFAAFLPAKGSSALAPYGGSVAVSPANDLLGNTRRTKGTADLGAIQVGP